MTATVVPFPHGDNPARQAIANDLDTTLVVEAAAGTGKTTELIKRILRVLEAGRAEMRGIVAVTFTEKAAGELKLRLREELERRRAHCEKGEGTDASLEGVRGRLEAALATLEEAHVNTIHGFCADLLRERPVEARVDPLFGVLTEAQADRLFSRAFRAWLQEALERPADGVRRALRRSGGDMADGPIGRLRSAAWALAESRDFPCPWRRPPFDRDSAIDRVVTALHRLAHLTEHPLFDRDNLYLDTDGARRLSRQIRLEESFGHRDLDAWESRLVDLLRDRGLSRTRKGSGYRFSADATRTDVLAARDGLFAALQEFKRDADADLAAALHHELAGATERYQALKRAAGVLDFTDLLSRARDLIRDNRDVREHLQRTFVRIFVDEFQDTDPIQAEILLLLAGDVPGKLFLVGDPKQSIYRFRGTDLATYWQVRDQLAARGARVLELTTSYRSVPDIQHFINAAFSGTMSENRQTRQAAYIPLAESRAATAGQPAVVALPVPKPYGRSGSSRPSPKAIEESLPDAIAAFIEWLVKPGNAWKIEGKPIAPQHVAILFRRFVSFGQDVTRRYVDAIEARGIPHVLVGGKAFHGREEVEAIRAALAAIEWPDDELSVFATLKGPLLAIHDEHLLDYRHRFGPFHPFRVPNELGGNSGLELALTGEPAQHLRPIADALRLLQQLHRRRNYRPVADTIGRLLAETRAHVGFILRPAGEQALANVLHIAELARQYETGGGISFRGFIETLREAAAGEAAEAPIVEEGSDGVRLMTVHKAKGLEFPVVILADLTCRLSRNDASRHLDASQHLCAIRIGGWAPHELHDHEAEEVARDEAEGVRLAYVAATRARDLLVVPTLGDGPWEGGWTSPLNSALYPPMPVRRQAASAPGCPPFKSRDSVLERPNDEPAGPVTVCPGQHRLAGAGGYAVVWWDPGALSLGAKPPFGVRREDLIVKDVPKSVIADGRSRYDAWQLARHDALARGAVPSMAVQTAREFAEIEGIPRATDIDIQTVDLREVSDRPRGAAFGFLVHEILATAPFDAKAAMLKNIAFAHARALGLAETDVAPAATLVERALTHAVFRRAREADARGACRRETPVTCEETPGVLVEGVVDLAFECDGVWTVVDYKTDVDLPADSEARYRRQVELYASAIARATGQRASALVVRL